MKIVLFFFVSLIFIQSCFAVDSPTSNAAPISHDIFDRLLKKYVTDKGEVNYAGFKKEQKEFAKYQDLISKNAPASNWSKNEILAYWINAYNAFTIQLILDNADQKITSIKDIGSKIKIPFVNTPWDVKFIEIGGKKMDLNNIEHGIIRKQFKEPRIHFALVCAAKSCPPLRNEAFTAERLDAQLNSQAEKFINDDSKNNVSANSAEVSKIFDWYGMDFKPTPIIDILNKYSKTKISNKGKITFKTYDWALNGSL
ncbi:DUF547 domain-containing protein [Lacihabitans sp. LS3-19]|uniref:DUF547 domain-containing protein n=1 Tax=Lacihabitans sp. LS3-19 TaxID=2487335 RepID=UPI0020CF8C92|nr:DUF547 domain-containing protein [Lacihabitans sp. LS3-19]MCP9767485.1 DUF547 domain-containing protein [Lacihabitans sp. LS3-19]